MARDKAPAFQFYPKDWDTDVNVIPMTYEEEGVYFALCRIVWLAGSLPADLNELRLLLKGRPSLRQIQKWWTRIGKCFERRDDRLVHPRVERERQKQKDWAGKSRDGGKKRAATAPRYGGKFTSHSASQTPAILPAKEPATVQPEHQPTTSIASASALASSEILSTSHPNSTPSAGGEDVWGMILENCEFSEQARKTWFQGWRIAGYTPGKKLEVNAPSAAIRNGVNQSFAQQLKNAAKHVAPGLQLILGYKPLSVAS